jgi:stage V sporulation protein AC
MNKEEYGKYVKERAKKSPVLKDTAFAFLIGGLLCIIGQIFCDLYVFWGVSAKDSISFASMTLIFISFLLTSLGFFDNIAKIAGAGTLVPITGFANAVVSCAIDNKSEGYILGVGAKIFSIAGPVILYGIASGAIYGVIYYFFYYI